jgi:hypothetical protein
MMPVAVVGDVHRNVPRLRRYLHVAVGQAEDASGAVEDEQGDAVAGGQGQGGVGAVDHIPRG